MTAGKPGRPRLAEDLAQLYVRVPREVYVQMIAAAESRGMTLSEWARDVLGRSARQTLR